MTRAWHPGLFSPFLRSVDYVLLLQAWQQTHLATQPWTAILLQNWGLLISLEKFQIRRLSNQRVSPVLHPVAGCKDSKIIIFPQGSQLDRIQGVGLTHFPSSPKVHPSKTSSMPLSSSASPHQASPPACAEIWQAAESQGLVGKQLQMNFGFWMKELDNNCSSLSEGNTEKPDPNLPILSWQCDLASVTAICVFRFLRHRTKPGCAHLPTEVWGCRVD